MSMTSPMLGSFLLRGTPRSYVTAPTPQLAVAGVNAVKQQLGLVGENPRPAKLATGAWLVLLPTKWAHAHKGQPGKAPFKADARTLKLLGDDGDGEGYDFADPEFWNDPIKQLEDLGKTLGEVVGEAYTNPGAIVSEAVDGSRCELRRLQGEDVWWYPDTKTCEPVRPQEPEPPCPSGAILTQSGVCAGLCSGENEVWQPAQGPDDAPEGYCICEPGYKRIPAGEGPCIAVANKPGQPIPQDKTPHGLSPKITPSSAEKIVTVIPESKDEEFPWVPVGLAGSALLLGLMWIRARG